MTEFHMRPKLLSVAALTKGAECVTQVEKCARACTPNARGVGEIKVFGPAGFYVNVLRQERQ